MALRFLIGDWNAAGSSYWPSPYNKCKNRNQGLFTSDSQVLLEHRKQYSLLSHSWWGPLIKFMMESIIYIRGGNIISLYSRTTQEFSALHIAAEAGHVHIVEESVNLENLEIRDDDGLKALAQASFFVVELNFPESV